MALGMKRGSPAPEDSRRGAEAQRLRCIEVYWEGGAQLHRSRFQQQPWSTETVKPKNSPKKLGAEHGI